MSAEDLNRETGIDRFSLARGFRAQIGTSPHRYVSQMRMENAMQKIAAGKLPLIEVALDAGFSSQASFTRAFRRETGVTPGEYRRQRR